MLFQEAYLTEAAAAGSLYNILIAFIVEDTATLALVQDLKHWRLLKML
jgi:hypothetical protein